MLSKIKTLTNRLIKTGSYRFFGLTVVVSLLAAQMVWSQQTPAKNQQEKIAVVGAMIHLGNGELIENGTLVFDQGKISYVGPSASADTNGARTIQANGKHVYPGFIAPGKSLGLIEVNAVRASNDQDEIGDFIPHVRSIIAYNAESQVVESLRPNGILLAQIAPVGGVISGTSSIVQLDAWNWEDAAIKMDDGIHLHWPSTHKSGRWWLGEPPGFNANKKYQEEIDKISGFLGSARAYNKGKDRSVNRAYSAMKRVFDGSAKVFVYAHDERQITDAINALKKFDIDQIVLVGGYRAVEVADLLKENKVPVLVRHTHSLPYFDSEDYDFTYKLPKLLVDVGLLVGLQNSAASNFQVRNLPFYAGQVVGAGLDKEEALKLITGNTAKILGIDDKVGTLEKGKSATFFISKGDALDMMGNQLEHAFIDGREISLETHQTELWKRYSGKFSEGK